MEVMIGGEEWDLDRYFLKKNLINVWGFFSFFCTRPGGKAASRLNRQIDTTIENTLCCQGEWQGWYVHKIPALPEC